MGRMCRRRWRAWPRSRSPSVRPRAHRPRGGRRGGGGWRRSRRGGSPGGGGRAGCKQTTRFRITINSNRASPPSANSQRSTACATFSLTSQRGGAISQHAAAAQCGAAALLKSEVKREANFSPAQDRGGPERGMPLFLWRRCVACCLRHVLLENRKFTNCWEGQ